MLAPVTDKLQLTATELPRFMACNGSRYMDDFQSSIESDHTVRNEGDAIHWLAEQILTGKHSISELVDRKAPNGLFITADMLEHSSEYISDMIDKPNLEIEVSGYLIYPNATITTRTDCRYIEGNTLYINDFKYGWGIVEPENNWTLIAYAMDYFQHCQHDIHHVVMTIYQPRPHHHKGHVRSWKITAEQLISYASRIFDTLSNPNDQLNTGEHCRNCPALTHCPAAHKAEMNAVDASEIAFNDNISDKVLSLKLDTIKRAADILKEAEKAYSELALHRLKSGQIIDNYSIDNDLTNEKWKDGISVDVVKAMTGIDVSKPSMITPNQAIKKGVPETIVKSLCERQSKGVKLIRISANDKANKLFNQQKGK